MNTKIISIKKFTYKRRMDHGKFPVKMWTNVVIKPKDASWMINWLKVPKSKNLKKLKKSVSSDSSSF